MIVTSNITVIEKTYATLLKIILYLLLYVHLVACMWWATISYNSNLQFTKFENGFGEKEFCLYADEDNTIFNITGT
jgi:hypothetical protein